MSLHLDRFTGNCMRPSSHMPCAASNTIIMLEAPSAQIVIRKAPTDFKPTEQTFWGEAMNSGVIRRRQQLSISQPCRQSKARLTQPASDCRGIEAMRLLEAKYFCRTRVPFYLITGLSILCANFSQLGRVPEIFGRDKAISQQSLSRLRKNRFV